MMYVFLWIMGASLLALSMFGGIETRIEKTVLDVGAIVIFAINFATDSVKSYIEENNNAK